MKRVAWAVVSAAMAVCALPLAAKVVTQTVAYDYKGQKMQGYLAYDDAKAGPRPGVLVVHEWWGLNDYIRGRARQMAEMGYVAFAPDMYGDGKTTRDPKEAGAWSTAAQAELVPRAKAGLEQLKKAPGVDRAKLGAMGFCFGGSTALALAYSGEDLKGTVLFHASLFPPENATRIKSPIVILHGEKDTFIKPETITQVKDALDAAKVDWYMVTYANSVHAFTNPDADSFKIPGVGYNEKAARRSWDEMQHFFRTQFGGK
jgi:dienelactone hydrolase